MATSCLFAATNLSVVPSSWPHRPGAGKRAHPSQGPGTASTASNTLMTGQHASCRNRPTAFIWIIWHHMSPGVALTPRLLAASLLLRLSMEPSWRARLQRRPDPALLPTCAERQNYSGHGDEWPGLTYYAINGSTCQATNWPGFPSRLVWCSTSNRDNFHRNGILDFTRSDK